MSDLLKDRDLYRDEAAGTEGMVRRLVEGKYWHLPDGTNKAIPAEGLHLRRLKPNPVAPPFLILSDRVAVKKGAVQMQVATGALKSVSEGLVKNLQQSVLRVHRVAPLCLLQPRLLDRAGFHPKEDPTT